MSAESADDAIALLFALGLGPWLTPLVGKAPYLDAWQAQPPVDETRVRQWVALGFNLGFRAGPQSGFLVIDTDQPRHPEGPQDFTLPPTGLMARSPTGSLHGYYRHAGPWPKNSSSVLAVNVDVKSEGGQVVVPPSVHPVAGKPYVWVSTDEPGTIPAGLFPTAPVVDMTRPVSVPTGVGYAATALAREVHAVRNAVEGTRNDTLNRAAFSVGQLVAGVALDSETARSELLAAAAICGLPEHEASRTIHGAFQGGAASPRRVPERTVAVATAPAPVGKKTEIFIPGGHPISEDNFLEVGNDTFGRSILDALTPGALYGRSGTVGEIVGGQFVVVTADRLRSIVDTSIKLVAGKAGKNEGDPPSIVFRTCLKDHASVLLAYAAANGTGRELKHVSRYPVCVGPDFTPARPGWNADAGLFLACNAVPEPLPLDEARAVLEDLVCDFPFAAPVDRANFFGLLLTVIVRPAIGEPVPMHLLNAPMVGSGKSKLAEIVMGCGVLGFPLPATQIGVREEEREKRITGSMLAGESVVHLDNLNEFVDSASLASLLTCSIYRGRPLGASTMVSIPNDSTVVGSGNSVHVTDEIARRIIPITLQPDTESPETRQDYRHPLLRKYVESQTARVRGALFGLVAAWRAAGRPLCDRSVGSFERWSAVVGGIMQTAGYPEWATNLQDWRGTADDSRTEIRAFVDLWHGIHGLEWIDVGTLFDLAETHELFSRKLTQTTPVARKTAFTQRVLSSLAGRVVGKHRIEVAGSGKRRQARLLAL